MKLAAKCIACVRNGLASVARPAAERVRMSAARASRRAIRRAARSALSTARSALAPEGEPTIELRFTGGSLKFSLGHRSASGAEKSSQQKEERN